MTELHLAGGVQYQTVWTPQLDRNVLIRSETSDRQTWLDTFGEAGGYHIPPPSMPAPRLVLDLGANIGLTAAHYQVLWPDANVVAVEMDADNAALARINGARHVLNVAVGRHAGVGSYQRDGVDAYAYALTHVGGDHTVAVASFTDLARLYRPDFVKFDIEGAEWGILADAAEWAEVAPRLLLELHPDSDHANDSKALVRAALGLLRAAGYTARRHPPHPQAVWAVRK